MGWVFLCRYALGREVRRPAWVACLALLYFTAALPASADRSSPSARSTARIEILTCEEIPRALELVRATLRVSAGPRSVALADLRCGAFRPDSANVLYLNGLEETGTLSARESRTVHAVFPRNAAHSECRCVVEGDFQLATLGDFREAPQEWDKPAVQYEIGPVEGLGGNDPVALPLRRERVVIPGTIVRSGPGHRHPALGTLADGDTIRVYAVASGWKEIRGLHEGWIPADASTAGSPVIPELRASLAELQRRIRGGDAASLCALPPGDFSDLIFSWQPERGRALLHPPWHELKRGERDAFRRYALDCFGIAELGILGDSRLAESSETKTSVP